MKVTKNKTLSELKQIEKKYETLVWYARKTPEQIVAFPQLKSLLADVEKRYPEETRVLNTPDSADWEHGFNSGMLAATRLTQNLLDMPPEVAYINFPDLMT